MRRYPELAHIACTLPDVQNAAHVAIDKLTAVGLLCNQINRPDNSPVKEIELCEKMNMLLAEAHFNWQSYMTLKLKKYEELLHWENQLQSHELRKCEEEKYENK